MFISCSIVLLSEDTENKMHFQVAVGVAQPCGPGTSDLLITSSQSTRRYFIRNCVRHHLGQNDMQ